MAGRQGDRWVKNMQLSTMVKTVQTIYRKKTRYRFWTTNQRRKNDRNRMGYKRRKIQRKLLGALGPEATNQITRSECRTEMDKIKNRKLIKLYNRY